MARQMNGFSPEFADWLKSNKVSIRKLQKNPESLGQYYQEWSKTSRRTRKESRPPRLSNLNLDIGTILNGVKVANEVFKTFQGTNGIGSMFRRFM
ncbi:hypothetical protein HPY28_25670 [Brevibacillus sp. HB1.2]|uniref:hypothetical protein n=1 Tax=Brevibacillus TaxID=55080 RepID=UPI0004784F52|nr:hypothetical protein [Brevibacillus sp. HB1.4B]NTU23715.1 hypothetical protein [Brevibacillus sp. HB1.2]NTU33682.1 hypothetical protein [Brevibacillus sp. HB1.1]